MNPIRVRLGNGRRLRLERCEARRLLSVSPTPVPAVGLGTVPLTVQVAALNAAQNAAAESGLSLVDRPAVVFTDSPLASGAVTNGWTPVFSDSDLSVIGSTDGVVPRALSLSGTETPRTLAADLPLASEALSFDLDQTSPLAAPPGLAWRLESVLDFFEPTPEEPRVIDVEADPLEPTVVVPTVGASVVVEPVAVEATVVESVAAEPALGEPITVAPLEPSTVIATQPTRPERHQPTEPSSDDAFLASIATEVAREESVSVATPEADNESPASFVPWQEEPTADVSEASPINGPIDEPLEPGPASAAGGPMERLAAADMPAAGVDVPGAGMVDLAALLLEPTQPQSTPQAEAPLLVEVDARDAALAVESWVRSSPAASVLPASASPPQPGTQVQMPAAGLIPMDARDRSAEAIRPVRSTIGRVSTVETRPEVSRSPSGRLVGPFHSAAFHYAAVAISTLLSGSVIWTSRRGDPPATPNSYDRPRRKRR